MTTCEKVNAKINNFYLFNSMISCKDGQEEDKILFYYPKEHDSSTRVKNVGITEAIIKFTNTFGSKEPCESLHTKKCRRVFYEAEKNYWMVMTIWVPYIKSKDGLQETTYLGCNVQDQFYLSLLQNAYRVLSIFFGNFSTLSYDSNDVNNMKEKINDFLTTYVEKMDIDNNLQIHQLLRGIQYLPLDKKTFLHVTCFLHQLQSAFQHYIQFTAFFVNDSLVWNDLDNNNMQTIYSYIVNNLLGQYVTTDYSSINDISIYSPSIYPRFIKIDQNNCEHDLQYVQKIVIDGKSFYMLIFHTLSSLLCIFLKENIEITRDLLTSIELLLRKKMMTISTQLVANTERKIKESPESSIATFLYFNRLNLAFKSSMEKKIVPESVYNVLLDILFKYKKEAKKANSTWETVAKTDEDYWIVGEWCKERQLYLVTQQKNATLVEISEELKKISDKQLKSVFFHI